MGKAYDTVYRRPTPIINYLSATDRDGYTMHAMYTCINLIRHEFIEPYTFSFKLNEVKQSMLDAGVEGVTNDFIATKLLEIKAMSGANVFERRKSGTGVVVGMGRGWDDFYRTYLLRLDAGKKSLYEKILQSYKE